MGRHSDDDPRSRLSALAIQKQQIESELAENHAILQSHNVQMDTPLVDNEGFPRADIDIITVRSARVRIIHLRNDLKSVLDNLAEALAQVHAQNSLNAGNNNNNNSNDLSEEQQQQQQQDRLSLQPFARVDGVAPGSPADSAGLRREDLILSFGIITYSSLPSPNNLAPLAALAAEYEDRSLKIKVLRPSQSPPAQPSESSSSGNTNTSTNSPSDVPPGTTGGRETTVGVDQHQYITLTLIPRKGWGGRGLLG